MRKKYIILSKADVSRSQPRYRSSGRGVGLRPRLTVESLSEKEAGSIAAEPGVEAISPAMPTRLIFPLVRNAEPNEAPTNDAWGLEAVGALASAATGAGVTVAVLDTGIDADHPAFDGMTIEQMDFSGDGDGDRQGHGTHCAGTIFGRDVNGVRIGVARGVQHALIGKVLGDTGGGDSQMIFEGMQWALNKGANIISMSLGFDFPGMVAEQVADGWPADLATSNALEAYRGNLRMFDAIMQLARARGGLGGGAVVVAAAGNESQRDQNPDWRIAASLPAAAEDVVSVAAVGRNGGAYAVADFSNSMAMLSGPGVHILSAKTGGGLSVHSGTSMACPHVAGVAALWWEAVRTSRSTNATLVRAKLLSEARNAVFGQGGGLEVDVGVGLVTAP